MSPKRKSLAWILFLLAAGGWAQVPPRPPVGPAAAAGPGTPGGEARGELRTTVWRGREVTYEVINGWAVYDGDILLGRVEEIEAQRAGAASFGGSVADPGSRRDLVPPEPEWLENTLWPGGIIPYEIVEDATDQERAETLAAMAEWNARTAITFVPRTGQRFYARLFRPAPGHPCTAYRGRGDASGAYTVGCGVSATVHELGHVVGLGHEHQRPDRDKYIMHGSLRYSLAPSFSLGTGPYDYRSSMTYGGGVTIPPGMPHESAGSLEGYLSAGDVAGVNRLYGQPSEATVVTTNPPGLEIVVDGVRVTTPATIHWPAGSAHVLEAPLWQDNPWRSFKGAQHKLWSRGERAIFGRWSDEGDRVHRITASPDQTWFEANFIGPRSISDAGSFVWPKALTLGFGLPGEYEGIDASPRALSFVSAPGQNPPPGIFRLTNRRDGPERFRIVSDSPWLLAEPAEAGLGPGESVDIEVRALREGLRPEAHRGNLRVRTEGSETVEVPAVSVAFVVLPEMSNVPLGADGETVQVAVSETEGFLGQDGRPLDRDGRVTASNGDVYRLARGPAGIAATFEPSSQTLDLPSGGRVTLEQHAEGDWRIGDARVRSGDRYAAGGHEHVLEMADGRWRAAAYAVRTVADWNDGPRPDGIPAVEARVRPSAVALDADGSLYIAEESSHVVRKVDSDGVITTVAGTWREGYSGDGGPATAAELRRPGGLAVDLEGNLYIADTYNQVVRKVDSDGVITTVAGTGNLGYSGDGGPATAAELQGPRALAVDAAGNLYVGQVAGVRKIDADGVITTVAGTGESAWRLSSGGGLATETRLGWVRELALDAAGNLFVADASWNMVWKIDSDGVITHLNLPFAFEATGLAVDAAGNLFVAKPGDSVLLKRDKEGTVTIRMAALASDVAADAAGNLYVSEPLLGRVLKINPAGARTQIAGSAERNPLEPFAADSSGGVHMVYRREVLRIDPAGGATSLAFSHYLGDLGYQKEALALDGEGNIYAASRGRLLKIDATATRVLATFPRHQLGGLALDGHGNVLVCGSGVSYSDRWQVRLWRVYPRGGSYEADAVLAETLDRDGPRMERCGVDKSARVWFEAGTKLRVIEPLPGPSPAVVTLPGGGAIQLTKRDSGGWTLGDKPVRSGDGYVRGGTEYVLSRVGEHWRVSSVRVSLGTGTETVRATVRQDGSLWYGGRPLSSNSQVTGPDFNTYTITVGPGGVAATLVPRSQTVELERGAALRLSQDQNGGWRTGRTGVERGQEIVQNGWSYRLERTQGRWQAVTQGPLYSIRTAVGSTAMAEGVAASTAGLYRPGGIAVDTVGNVFVADTRNHRIRRVDLAGVIRTVAGSGEAGYGGDGGPATAARLLFPQEVAVDATGRIYVADTGNDRVRQISAAGTITTLAGGGSKVPGVPATEARLYEPTGVAVDTMGNLYVAEPGGRVTRIDSEGTITTFAGAGRRGSDGDGGPATEARLFSPHGVAADSAGNVYVVGGVIVNKIDSAGIITRVAVDGDLKGVAVDSAGSVYVADSYDDRVRRIDALGVISTVAGTGRGGFGGDGGAATEARLSAPEGVAADTAGNVYVADTGNHRVRRVDTAGTITTLAGTGNPVGGWAGGPAGQARLLAPASIAVDAAGDVLFADGHRVWKLDASGMVTVVAGTGEPGSGGDGGPATEARLAHPGAVAVDTSGNVYVADIWNYRVRRIDTAGVITTVAGGGTGGDGGQATEADLLGPRGVAVDSAGNLYLADRHLVRRVDISGIITTVAGGGSGEMSGPDGRAAVGSRLWRPTAVAVDTEGNLFIVDWNGRRLSKVDLAAGTISTLIKRWFGDVRALTAVATDLSGNVFVAIGHQIRRMNADGSDWVIAGTGKRGFNGDGSRATDAELSVSGLAVDSSRAVWFSDPVNRRVRVLDPAR